MSPEQILKGVKTMYESPMNKPKKEIVEKVEPRKIKMESYEENKL